VIAENVGERRADDRLEAVAKQGPGRVFAGRSAAEIVAGDQDRCTRMLGLVDDEIGVRLAGRQVAPVVEQIDGLAIFAYGLEIARRNDLVRVDVLYGQSDGLAGELGDCFHVCTLLGQELAGIGDGALDGGGGRSGWAGEEGPAALALASLKVTVAGRNAVLPGAELVAVHGDAHRAARLPPL